MKLTAAQTQKLNIANIARLICAMLGWSIADYYTLITKSGRKYLQAHISEQPGDIDILVECPSFWKWWLINWQQRDEQFLSTMSPLADKLRLELSYTKDFHDPYELAKSITPNGVVLYNSYAVMFQEVIDKKEAK